MRWKNGADHWGVVTRLLHWGFALIILIEIPAGFIMSRTYGATDPVLAQWQYWTSNFHHTVGMLLLLLAFLRAGWRLAGRVPDSPGSKIERRMARTTHWMLYALLLLIPLSGWAALSSLADSPQFRAHLWFFGIDGFGPHGFIPRIVPPVRWDSDHFFRYGLFSASHRWLLIAGAILLTLHILAALRHHIVLRDTTLSRMMRGTAPSRIPSAAG